MRRPQSQAGDAVATALRGRAGGASLLSNEPLTTLADSSPFSIGSHLQLNIPGIFARKECAQDGLCDTGSEPDAPSKAPTRPHFVHGRASLYHADCIQWMQEQNSNSVHAVVTDPPYGLLEYSDVEQDKLRRRKGGIWRIPPSFDGAKRAPLPRFTVLSAGDLAELERFFFTWGRSLLRVLVPGANVVVASNPLLSYIVSGALARSGLERRGELVRLVMTMRGGDRPKGAHVEFEQVSVMPRSMWEPWLVFRKPLEGRVQDNLRKWGTGGFRRISNNKPFGDVIESLPTRASERRVAPHPSLKPQSFLRKLVRGVLPVGQGVVCDPFAGSGSTLAAAEAMGYDSIGTERDQAYFDLATAALPRLADLRFEAA